MDQKKQREFKLTTLALKNRNTIFLLTGVIILFGMFSYRNLPKELFPEIVLPTILVRTIYPGNPPLDIENLITRPIEREVEAVHRPSSSVGLMYSRESSSRRPKR